jgi:hypothetical protein
MELDELGLVTGDCDMGRWNWLTGVGGGAGVVDDEAGIGQCSQSGGQP